MFYFIPKKYYYNKIMHYDDIITHYIYCKSCYKSMPNNINNIDIQNINSKECKLINDTCFYDTIEYAVKHNPNF